MAKDLLGLRGVSRGEIERVLDRAKTLKPRITNPAQRGQELKGRVVCSMFYENSTRTRLSFMAASAYMGAVPIDLGVSSSSVNKGETLVDTTRNIDAMGIDALVVRHTTDGSAALVAANTTASVINGGDGANEHPTQALLDIMTLIERKGGLDGLKIAIIGDIAHSRVAKSNAYGMAAMGASVVLCGYKTLLPKKAPGGAAMTDDIREAVRGADVVMTLRVQRERIGEPLFASAQEYAHLYQITPQILTLAKPEALVMHPGPINRGVEISADVADCERSVILEQTRNGVAVRMAVLENLLTTS